jgi:ankyrin repeat protein
MIIQAYIKHILDIDNTFVYACSNGDLNMVKSLLSEHHIDIHHKNELAFSEACRNGHLEVVKYLISLNMNINIHAKDEDAFREACRYGRLKIIKYLWEIDKTFKIKRNNYWPHRILKWYDREYLKVNPNIRDIIEKDKLFVINGIMKKCNICSNEKHVIMFGCHEDHGLCKECF